MRRAISGSSAGTDTTRPERKDISTTFGSSSRKQIGAIRGERSAGARVQWALPDRSPRLLEILGSMILVAAACGLGVQIAQLIHASLPTSPLMGVAFSLRNQ